MDLGYCYFDCVVIYGNEVEIGVILVNVFIKGVVKWEEFWIIFKLWSNVYYFDVVLFVFEKIL